MSPKSKAILGAALAAAMIAVLGAAARRRQPSGRSMSRSAPRRAPPIGWVEFCNEHAEGMRRHRERAARRGADRRRSGRTWCASTSWVNDSIKPVTDLEHWGVVEKWSYPDDGKGDCEDYVLLKRRMLMQAGWPREALLITVVRDKKGDGHAVLTVKTDKGDFILDNQEEEVLLWSDTGYRFVKRQSQSNPNVWVSLGDPRPAVATAAASHIAADQQELRVPGHVPTPPRPQTGFARGRRPPTPAAPFCTHDGSARRRARRHSRTCSLDQA